MALCASCFNLKISSDVGNAPKSLDIGSVDSGCSGYLEGEQKAGGVGWHLRTTKVTQGAVKGE